MEAENCLNGFMVGSLPTVIYIPNFISDSEQTQILNQIYQVPVYKWKSLKNRRLQNWGGVVHEKGLLPQDLPPWLTKVTHRIREQTGLFPSAINHVLINEYLPDQGIMPHQDGPAYFPVVAILSLGSPVVMNFTPHSRLRECTKKVENDAIDSISDRKTVEIGTNVDSEQICRQVDRHDPFSVLLMPCSLLIFKDEAYSDYLHGIQDSNIQRFDQAVNDLEALKHQENYSSDSENALEAKCVEQCKSIHRTTTRVSLTCRSVLKVHNNLFKF
eukprot:TRINITY_DN3968_c0_g1_i1.p1 TRINITY_DN3968_c0_g1~~TRINITY_DN3968_c0_g1_i1.p1  ORF type:complete len:307 (+),score=37.77 TRINITY_DN3968_c0_g1_i1:106-921(+)